MCIRDSDTGSQGDAQQDTAALAAAPVSYTHQDVYKRQVLE